MSEQQLKNFNDIADLQDELLNIDINDEHSLDLLYQKLSISELLKNKWTFRSVLVSIYTCYLSRPHSHMRYIELFIKIAKLPLNTYTSDDYVLSFTNNFFLYQLLLVGLVNISSIYELSSRSTKMVKYFYPEIKEKYPNLPTLEKSTFGHIIKYVKQAGYEINDNDTQEIINKFIELRAKGENPDAVALSIRHDDIERLQQLLYQTNTPVDKKIEHSIFERFIFINDDYSPSLIEYAAFFGSIECFKFLYQKLESFPQNLSQFAVAGGNYEIIHLCEQEKIQFDDESLMVSIRFFRSEITSYIEENFNVQKTIDDASKAIVYYNLRALMDCEPIIREDPNRRNTRGYTLLTLACLNGDQDIINYLITTFSDKIDINTPTTQGETPLSYAAEFGHYELVKYLVSFPNININSTSKSGITPLMYAIRQGHLNVVKFLASLPKIKILDDSAKIFSILELSVESNKLDIVKYVWNTLVFDNMDESKKKFLRNNFYFKFQMQLSLHVAMQNESKEIIDFLGSIFPEITNEYIHIYNSTHESNETKSSNEYEEEEEK